MKRTLLRNIATICALSCIALFAVLGMPKGAHAAAAEVPSAAYPDLAAAINADEKSIEVTGATTACDIQSDVTIAIQAGGSIAGDFLNAGTITGASRCTGTIYNTGSVDGGNVRVPGSAVSGVSTVIYADWSSEGADYKNNTLWIPSGKSIAYLVISDYICRPNGSKLECSITYLYQNARNSAMSLNSKTYPAKYNPKYGSDPITIPAAPDTEIDYVFSGWVCSALGVDETNMQKTLTIPAGTIGNITIVSCWTYSNGHNEGLANATTGMTASGGAAGGMSGMSGMSGASGGGAAGGAAGGVAGLLATDDDDDDDDTVTNVLTGTQGGMRVRNASSTTRHSFTNTGDDVEARANARKQKRFPWQWVGIGLGGAVLLFAVGLAIRRRRNERDAATLEKLNIHD